NYLLYRSKEVPNVQGIDRRNPYLHARISDPLEGELDTEHCHALSTGVTLVEDIINHQPVDIIGMRHVFVVHKQKVGSSSCGVVRLWRFWKKRMKWARIGHSHHRVDWHDPVDHQIVHVVERIE